MLPNHYKSNQIFNSVLNIMLVFMKFLLVINVFPIDEIPLFRIRHAKQMVCKMYNQKMKEQEHLHREMRNK